MGPLMSFFLQRTKPDREQGSDGYRKVRFADDLVKKALKRRGWSTRDLPPGSGEAHKRPGNRSIPEGRRPGPGTVNVGPLANFRNPAKRGGRSVRAGVLPKSLKQQRRVRS